MTEKINLVGRNVYIVDGSRTPFLKAKNQPGPFGAADLAVAAGKQLLKRQNFIASDLDEVILGSVIQNADEANVARLVALRLGCGPDVTAWTVQRNCASGMQAIDNAALNISSGRSDLILAGGVDAMSHAPLLFSEQMANWLGSMVSAKTPLGKLKQLTKIKPKYFKPVVALLKGLNDPIVNLSMGQTAENLAYKFNISRTDMDEFAADSHRKLANAQDEKQLVGISTLYDKAGNYYQHDDGLRRDSSVEKLSRLKPFFDKKFGAVTPGNSSQITDGAALILLASETAIKRFDLPVLGRIVDTNWAGLAPEDMGLGPVHATTPMLQKHGLQLNDIDYWEINEAFAAQVLACLAAWRDDEYCRNHFGGLAGAFGSIDHERLNIDGGAIALGHPVGSSGARIVWQLLNVLRRKQAKCGVATICIGGGQGGAMLVENTSEVAA